MGEFSRPSTSGPASTPIDMNAIAGVTIVPSRRRDTDATISTVKRDDRKVPAHRAGLPVNGQRHRPDRMSARGAPPAPSAQFGPRAVQTKPAAPSASTVDDHAIPTRIASVVIPMFGLETITTPATSSTIATNSTPAAVALHLEDEDEPDGPIAISQIPTRIATAVTPWIG